MAVQATKRFFRIIWATWLAAAMGLNAGSMTGILRFNSCAPMERYRLVLRQLPGRDLGASVDLTLPLTVASMTTKGEWIPGINVWFCGNGSDCDVPVQCRIRVKKFSRATIAGDIDMLFSDGQKISGPFKAARTRPSQTVVCE